MDLQQLRSATRADHEATEAVLPLMAAKLTRADYVEALQRFYAAVRAWDVWSEQHVPAALGQEMTGRHRSALLEADLRFFNVEPRKSTTPMDPEATANFWPSEAWFLGAMYVVEGSTLGGQYIAAHVEQTLGLEPGHGDLYFRGYASETGSRWNRVKELLLQVPQAEAEQVIAGAHYCFGFFRAALSGATAAEQ